MVLVMRSEMTIIIIDYYWYNMTTVCEKYYCVCESQLILIIVFNDLTIDDRLIMTQTIIIIEGYYCESPIIVFIDLWVLYYCYIGFSYCSRDIIVWKWQWYYYYCVIVVIIIIMVIIMNINEENDENEEKKEIFWRRWRMTKKWYENWYY